MNTRLSNTGEPQKKRINIISNSNIPLLSIPVLEFI